MTVGGFSRSWGRAGQSAAVDSSAVESSVIAIPLTAVAAAASEVATSETDASASDSSDEITVGDDVIESELRLRYLPWQLEVRRALRCEGCTTAVLACGARIGKDRGTNQLLVELPLSTALERSRPGSLGHDLIPRVNCWLAAPTSKLYQQNWQELNELLPRELVLSRNKQRGEILLRGGVRYAFKSTDTPENLVAEGLDYLAITEAGRVRSNVAWQESLLPRLSSPGRLGVAIVNGTPRNGKRHWYRQLWEKARACEDGTMRQWNLPTSANPLMTRATLAKLMSAMPERMYRSEILAIWPDEDEKPFRDSDIEALFCGGDARGPDARPPYVTAIDVARCRDETFATRWALGGGTAEVVAGLRMRQKRLPHQIERASAFFSEAPGKLILDSTANGGEFFADDMERALPGVRARRYDFHGGRKEDLFDALVVAVERRLFRIRRDLMGSEVADELKAQLELFESEITDDGRIDYHGPDGNRDDGVTSLALGWHEVGYRANGAPAFDYEAMLGNIF